MSGPGWPVRVGGVAPAVLPVRSESEVVSGWVGDRPVVSVLCPTFQHVGFIEDALRGFLGQVTDFPFEVIVRDDASSDGTAEVVRGYAERFPNVVRAVLETENRYPDVRPGMILVPMARGAFIATCEGDDYWTDPHKLQKQLQGLLARPDAALSHHPVVVVRDGRVVRAEKRAHWQRRDFTARELARGARVITSSVLWRNVSLEIVGARHFSIDLWVRARLGLEGGACWEGDIGPSVHRLHPGGVWSSRSEVERARKQRELFEGFAEEFDLRGERALSAYYRRMSRVLGGYEKAAATHPAIARGLAAVRLRVWGG